MTIFFNFSFWFRDCLSASTMIEFSKMIFGKYISIGKWICLARSPGPPKKKKILSKNFLYLSKGNNFFKQKNFSRPFERTNHKKEIFCTYSKNRFLKRKFFLCPFERTKHLAYSSGPPSKKNVYLKSFLYLLPKKLIFQMKMFLHPP